MSLFSENCIFRSSHRFDGYTLYETLRQTSLYWLKWGVKKVQVINGSRDIEFTHFGTFRQRKWASTEVHQGYLNKVNKSGRTFFCNLFKVKSHIYWTKRQNWQFLIVQYFALLKTTWNAKQTILRIQIIIREEELHLENPCIRVHFYFTTGFFLRNF